MTEHIKNNPIEVDFMGAKITLNSVDTIPRDGTPILVLLERESMKRVWHTAQYYSLLQLIGHCFAFDCPPVLGWLPLPEMQTNHE